ncbi:hypothetical protein G7Y89_g4959 [Cudoniella acicularis]|uniref:DUF6594 domain-containing protein n=1 Tax=Cudoniella acicularis TaxID=354080 RepID=A0A8H4RNE4_9HELO|nr:hypothetical protein G7Y89_g4959 [Cudoniella acicularis]
MTLQLDSLGRSAPEDYLELFYRYFKFHTESPDLEGAEIKHLDRDDHGIIITILQNWAVHRRFCRTTNHHFAWIPKKAQINDEIFIIRGARIPCVLRPQPNGKFQLVGECWIEGLMEGEALDLPGFKWEDDLRSIFLYSLRHAIDYMPQKEQFKNVRNLLQPPHTFNNDMSSRDISKEERGLHSSHDKPSKLDLRSSADWSFVAQYLNQDPDLWVFRRFGKLHLFNILCLQQRLAELENTLETKIWNDKTTGFDELLLDIKIALKEYGTAAISLNNLALFPVFYLVHHPYDYDPNFIDDALSAQANYRSYRQPEKHVFSLLESWWKIYHGRGSALRTGLDFHTEGKNRHKDLASIAALEKSWTHRFIDSNDCLRRFFAKNDDLSNQLPSTLLYSEENVQRAEAVFLHACFCCLLLCPIFALSYVRSNAWKLVILAVSLFATAVLTVGFLNAPNKNALALVAGFPIEQCRLMMIKIYQRNKHGEFDRRMDETGIDIGILTQPAE